MDGEDSKQPYHKVTDSENAGFFTTLKGKVRRALSGGSKEEQQGLGGNASATGYGTTTGSSATSSSGGNSYQPPAPGRKS